MPQPSLNRILVIPLRFIGDTILAVPLLRNLKAHFPDSQIDVLLSQTSAPLLAPCPYVHQTLIEPKGWTARLNLLKAAQYDAVFILRKSVSYAALCKTAGIPLRIGYDKQRWFSPLDYKRWGIFLTHPIRYPSLTTHTPQAISHLSHLAPLGLSPIDDHLELWNTAEDEQTVNTLLGPEQSGQPLAILHMVSASHGKSFSVEQFLEPVLALSQKGYRVICTGTAGDAPAYEGLAVLSGVALENWAGKTTLRETVALYRKAQLVLTVDSSPIHIAAATGVPNIVGVFGPTNEKQWGPHNADSRFAPVFLELPCRPCYAKICSHNSCRLQLTGQQIRQAVESLCNEPLNV